MISSHDLPNKESHTSAMVSSTGDISSLHNLIDSIHEMIYGQ